MVDHEGTSGQLDPAVYTAVEQTGIKPRMSLQKAMQYHLRVSNLEPETITSEQALMEACGEWTEAALVMGEAIFFQSLADERAYYEAHMSSFPIDFHARVDERIVSNEEIPIRSNERIPYVMKEELSSDWDGGYKNSEAGIPEKKITIAYQGRVVLPVSKAHKYDELNETLLEGYTGDVVQRPEGDYFIFESETFKRRFDKLDTPVAELQEYVQEHSPLTLKVKAYRSNTNRVSRFNAFALPESQASSQPPSSAEDLLDNFELIMHHTDKKAPGHIYRGSKSYPLETLEVTYQGSMFNFGLPVDPVKKYHAKDFGSYQSSKFSEMALALKTASTIYSSFRSRGNGTTTSTPSTPSLPQKS